MIGRLAADPFNGGFRVLISQAQEMGEDGELWLGTLIALPWAVSVLAPVNQIAKFLARLEDRNPLWRHFDLGASLWIASNAPLSEAGVEASEAADLNLIARPQGSDDAVEYGADDGVGFLQGQPDSLINRSGQIGPGHLEHSRCITKKVNTAAHAWRAVGSA